MSILNVNKISAVGGGSTITIAGIASVTNNISVGNSVTAGSFVGPIEGNVTGNLTGDVTGNTSGSSGSCTGNAATATLASGITTTASINTSGIVTATSFSGSGASLTGISSQDTLSFRNLIINGAMNVAQRATTSTSGSGYKTIDSWGWTYDQSKDPNNDLYDHVIGHIKNCLEFLGGSQRLWDDKKRSTRRRRTVKRGRSLG